MVDWDSTLNQFDEHFAGSVNEKFGTSIHPSHFTHWDYLRELPKEQVEWIWGTEAFDNKDWTLAIPPAPGAIHAVHLLRDAGYRVIVVSSRPLHHAQWIREWLDNYGLNDIEGWADPMKLAFAQEFAVTLAFEDAPHTVEQLATHCPVYLMDRPWNQDVAGDNIYRVESMWCAVEKMGL